jgi:hypothetical protein
VHLFTMTLVSANGLLRVVHVILKRTVPAVWTKVEEIVRGLLTTCLQSGKPAVSVTHMLLNGSNWRKEPYTFDKCLKWSQVFNLEMTICSEVCARVIFSCGNIGKS